MTGPGAPSRPARRTRTRRRPAAGAPAAGARVGGQSAARPTAGAAGGAIRPTTSSLIRCAGSRRPSRPGRCCSECAGSPFEVRKGPAAVPECRRVSRDLSLHSSRVGRRSTMRSWTVVGYNDREVAVTRHRARSGPRFSDLVRELDMRSELAQDCPVSSESRRAHARMSEKPNSRPRRTKGEPFEVVRACAVERCCGKVW